MSFWKSRLLVTACGVIGVRPSATGSDGKLPGVQISRQRGSSLPNLRYWCAEHQKKTSLYEALAQYRSVLLLVRPRMFRQLCTRMSDRTYARQ